MISPTARPDHRRREDHVDAEPLRVDDRVAEQDARERREEPRDERDADRREPVAEGVEPAEPSEVGDREREGLVGEEMGRDRPLAERAAAEPRRERRRVQDVAGVEQPGQDSDDRATATPLAT